MNEKPRLSEILEPSLRDLADRIETYAVEAVEDYHAIATGMLRNAIHVKLVDADSENWQIICYAEGTGAPYAQYVHEGREPGRMPPISPLMMWAKKKMKKGGGAMFPEIGSGMVNRTRVRVLKSGALSASKVDKAAFSAAQNIAWAVAKAIEKNGIPAKPFFVDALEKALEGL